MKSQRQTARQTTRVVLAAMFANLAIAIAKFVAAAFTGSSAMLAEGIHSVADTGNQSLLLIGERLSRKPPDAEHPFGHGRELYFWSLVVAIVLFGLGGGLSFYQGYAHLGQSEAIGNAAWSYAVLGVSFAAEGASWIVAMREFERRRGNRAAWRAFRESKDPRVFIPLAEDTAALLGLTAAFAGVFLSRHFSMPALDAVASMVIGVILAVVALVLARETRSLIVGEPASENTVRAIRDAVAADPAVAGVDEVVTMHSSPDSIFLNVEVRFRADARVSELAKAIERVRHRIRAVDRRISRVFVEVKPFRPAAESN